MATTPRRAPAETQPTEHAETATLAEQRAELAEQWAAISTGAAAPTGGRLWGLPDLPDGDMWVDMAGASVISGLGPKTITGYLNRGGPKRNPFPAPSRFLYRLFWPMSAVRAWREQEDGLTEDDR